MYGGIKIMPYEEDKLQDITKEEQIKELQKQVDEIKKQIDPKTNNAHYYIR